MVALVNYSSRSQLGLIAVVDGVVNGVGLVTLFSGQALKYTASGQVSTLYPVGFLRLVLSVGFGESASLAVVLGNRSFSRLIATTKLYIVFSNGVESIYA